MKGPCRPCPGCYTPEWGWAGTYKCVTCFGVGYVSTEQLELFA